MEGKILHIFKAEKFTNNFIEFIHSHFSIDEHDFWIYGNKDAAGFDKKCLEYDNIKFQKVNLLDMYKNKAICELLSYKKIIIHGFFSCSLIRYWALNKKLWKKTYIYLWGGDYYPEGLKNEWILDNIMRRMLLKNVDGIINILPEENEIVRYFYKSKGKMYYAEYIDDSNTIDIEKLLSYKKEIGDCIKIQLGNSATEENRHISILDALYKYKDQNIKIYVPLSYGDKNYAQEVISHGKKLFGDKFEEVTTYMDKEAYSEFMKSMHVAIFGMERQQALGNIMAHFNYKTTVYLNAESVLAKYFHRIGCSFKYIQDISKFSIDDFCYIPENEKNNNIIQIRKEKNADRLYEEWKMIFENID